jgi:hypothetical protein
MIAYLEFCDVIESAIEKNSNIESGLNNYDRSRSSQPVDGDGYDGLASYRKYDHTFSNAFNSNPIEESIEKFRSSLHESDRYDDGFRNTSRGYRNDDEPVLHAPKVTDSTTFRRSNHSGVNDNYNSSSWDKSQRRGMTAHNFPQAPRLSPSKMGSVMWGKEMPLSKKGNVPYVDDVTWCCAVCMYVENPNSKDKCLICDSPNVAVRKVR